MNAQRQVAGGAAFSWNVQVALGLSEGSGRGLDPRPAHMKAVSALRSGTAVQNLAEPRRALTGTEVVTAIIFPLSDPSFFCF